MHADKHTYINKQNLKAHTELQNSMASILASRARDAEASGSTVRLNHEHPQHLAPNPTPKLNQARP